MKKKQDAPSLQTYEVRTTQPAAEFGSNGVVTRIGRAWRLTFLIFAGFGPLAFASDIYDAVQRGNLAAVSRLLNVDPQLVHARDSEDCTPLHLAVFAGHAAVETNGVRAKHVTAVPEFRYGGLPRP